MRSRISSPTDAADGRHTGGDRGRNQLREARACQRYKVGWSADGAKIVYARLGMTPAGDVFSIMNADGRNAHRIRKSAGAPAWPARSHRSFGHRVSLQVVSGSCNGGRS